MTQELRLLTVSAKDPDSQPYVIPVPGDPVPPYSFYWLLNSCGAYKLMQTHIYSHKIISKARR